MLDDGYGGSGLPFGACTTSTTAAGTGSHINGDAIHSHDHGSHPSHGHGHHHHEYAYEHEHEHQHGHHHTHCHEHSGGHGLHTGSGTPQIYGERGLVSWKRFWSVLFKEHAFLGARLYTALLHMGVGVLLWAVGMTVDSLALVCYAFIVMFDAGSLFIGLVPTILEYSNNATASIEHPFGLQILPTLLEFANSLTLLYRAVQALKEGIEHMAVNGHEDHSASLEFETYTHKTQGHNGHALASFMLVLAALAITGYSAARFMNHHYLWEACSKQKQHLTSAMQNVLFNPFNISSLCAGLWMMVMIILAPSKEESVIEPLSCVLVAGIMTYTSFPTCVFLGKILLHAATGDSVSSARQVVWQISRLPNVASCSRCQVWNTTHEKYATALRISVNPDCDTSTLQRQIAGILSSYRLGDWTIEIRAS
ncbi:hypothetical protein GGI12_005329 [Dipsacomyces acuminosporus]|nr:hypothetical protein GGI12_005329 [Dipsacomyces acuminosporus]